MKQKIIYLLIILLCTSNALFSQKEVRKQLREGNKLYKQEKYTESEIAYRKGLEQNTQSVESAYNLGDALYKQGKFKEALEQYQSVANNTKNKATLAKTMHNIGNIFMSNKEYDKSVMSYKQSLILNPHDDETRYNLAVAQKKLKEQQQNQQDKKDQKDDKDKQDKQEQQQDKQDQQDKKDQNKQDQQQNQSQMDQEKAQQILDAFLQDEKNTQEKVQKIQMKQGEKRKTDKDW